MIAYRHRYLISLGTVVLAVLLASRAAAPAKTNLIHVAASDFAPGPNMATFDGTNHIRFVLDSVRPVPFNQSAIKQSTEAAAFGPDPKVPYFTVRFAMPIPPAYAGSEVAKFTGMDPMVFTHNHSPGFTILPNGDALAIWFSTPPGKAEADVSTSFVQARLRYGSEEWDMPELFFKTKNYSDQSGLLWNDSGKIWFFGYVAEGPARQWDEQGELIATHHFVNGKCLETSP